MRALYRQESGCSSFLDWQASALDAIPRYAIVQRVTQDADPQTFLPLSAAVFHVLVSLGDRDRHGYAIIKDVAERTSGAEHLGAGTLYAILRRLLVDGLIDEVDGPAEDARRRYYRLTRLGRGVARAEVERLERSTALARATGLFRRSRTS